MGVRIILHNYLNQNKLLSLAREYVLRCYLLLSALASRWGHVHWWVSGHCALFLRIHAGWVLGGGETGGGEGAEILLSLVFYFGELGLKFH